MRPYLQDKPLDLILDSILIPLIFIGIVLIKIGNIFKWVFIFILRLLILGSNFTRQTLNLKISLPKLPHIKLPKLPAIKISLPKISLPSVSSRPPRVHLPSPRRWPKIPQISLPRPSLKLQWFLVGVLFTFIFIFFPYEIWSALTELPNPQLLSAREIPVTTKIFDRNGFLLYEIYADQNRTPVILTDIPQALKDATIAIEDKQFYNHPGFSLRGIFRALKETVLNHKIQGGSTITQQLIRSALLTPEPTIRRKLKEIILSFWAERIYNKDQILEMYFNQVPYGGTAWGVEAAAQIYFAKSVKELNMAESAYLASLPASPSVYSPFGIHPEEGLRRQEEVLKKMSNQGYITSEQENEALNQKLVFQPAQTEIKAPHFVMYVKDILERKYGPRRVSMGGLQVMTTLDLPTQEMAQEIVANEIAKLAGFSVGNGAALVTNPKNGQILAMIGSKDYFDTQAEGNVNVVLSHQQPGSSIKVVNYALALEKDYTAATILDDSPVAYQIVGQPTYLPVNYDAKFHGKITLRQALANSYNVPAVKVLAKLGVKNMIEKGRLMGITSWKDDDRYGLSLTLGGGDVTMLDMAKVYGTLANQGLRQELKAILKVTDYKGQVLEENSASKGFAVVSPGIAFILADILADDQARSSAFGPNSLLAIPGKTVSVKTGTSNDLRDNWTIGFTPSYIVVTWVGNNDNGPMNRIASGITGATPIWHQIMANLIKDKPDESFSPPEDVVKLEACGRSEYFIKGTEKDFSCPPPPTPTPSP